MPLDTNGQGRWRILVVLTGACKSNVLPTTSLRVLSLVSTSPQLKMDKSWSDWLARSAVNAPGSVLITTCCYVVGRRLGCFHLKLYKNWQVITDGVVDHAATTYRLRVEHQNNIEQGLRCSCNPCWMLNGLLKIHFRRQIV